MDPVNRIIRKVEATVSRYRMIAPGERVVVAVSGGTDSVCLLNVFHSLKEALDMTLIVAHFDHGLRPEADDSETALVREMADSLHLDVAVRKPDPPLGRGDPSLEEKARELRYRFLRELKEAWGAQKIATGHTLNDQAETVLMRLLRGSGPQGLSGIRPVREDGVIRPLIELTREEVVSYLCHSHLEYATDASNFESTYLRNRVRLELLPQLETYQPRIIEILGRTADIAREDNQWMETQAKKWIEEWGQMSPTAALLPRSRLNRLPEALKNHVVREALKGVAGGLRQISLSHIEAIKRLIGAERPQARITLPRGIVVRRVYDRLIFSKGGPAPAESYSIPIERIGTVHIDALDADLTLETMAAGAPPQDIEADPWTLYGDADRIGFPLVLRNFRPGDRFVPLGMSGRKKVKDFFVDMKIPADLRPRIPLLVKGNSVIWVCGLRMDDRFKVTPATRRILKVAFTGPVQSMMESWRNGASDPSETAWPFGPLSPVPDRFRR